MSDSQVSAGPRFFYYTDYLRENELREGILRVAEIIGSGTVEQVMLELGYMMRAGVKEIRLMITSPGGNIYHSMAIYDALRSVAGQGIPVTAVVEGMAASAAAMIILQAANVRQARPNARFLLHEPRRWVFFLMERTSDVLDEAKEMQAVTNMVVDLLAKRCDKTPEEVWALIERTEVWMSAQEALEWGLIDQIA